MPTLPSIGVTGYAGNANNLSYGAADPSTVQPSAGERGYRRKKLAAMAGNVYKAGATAVNEIREGYAHIPRAGDQEDGHAKTTIPGSFPDVAITAKGDDQMVLFPSYAKRHIKQDWTQASANPVETSSGSLRDEDYWRREWEKDLDERAIVDVDVRGWLYSPNKGAMTRRNRMLVGLARQLSGIPAPKADAARPSAGDAGFLASHEAREDRREQEQVERKAAEIESKGQEEKRMAYRGEYSEPSQEDFGRGAAKAKTSANAAANAAAGSKSRSDSPASKHSSGANSPRMTAKEYTSASELTEAELAVANANLMARIAPFMTNPLVQLPITIFFYNDEKSASRTVQTNEAGHFIIRAALEFVPTHVRVMANSDLSAVQDVRVIEPRGVSLISDIDDTIKRSNISGGAKEIFRNTFVRELADLTVDGVREWYGKMHTMGVSIHYCSNSPWQLFPVLASFFMVAGLPHGSLHLKQYSGMLQGIFEPVAERKRGTLCRLMNDFPDRRFLLVGDSGEADLEVYTELATQYPGRVLAVFIRDVTSPEETAYFSSSFEAAGGGGADALQQRQQRQHPGVKPRHYSDDDYRTRPPLPSRTAQSTTTAAAGPVMGDLIDFSDEPEQTKVDHAAMLAQLDLGNSDQRDQQSHHHQPPTRTQSTTELVGRRAPPRPSKPAALRSAPSDEDKSLKGSGLSETKPQHQNSRGVPTPPLPRSRKPSGGQATPAEPQTQEQAQTQAYTRTQSREPAKQVANGPDGLRKSAQVSAGLTRPTDESAKSSSKTAPPPPPRRRGGDTSLANGSDKNSTGTRSVLLPPPPPQGSTSSTTRAATGLRQRGSTANMNSSYNDDADIDVDFNPLPPPASLPPRATTTSSTASSSAAVRRAGTKSTTGSPTGSPTLSAANKKIELWKRRVQRAHDVLDRQGVRLYTWRRGEDVIAEAAAIVEEAMGRDQRNARRGPGKGTDRGREPA